MESSGHILAIVGRPNVGKSTLFNRIAGRRIAIVHEEAGVTRDRVSARARWRNRSFEVVDTGGIAFLDEEKTSNALAAAARRQAEIAIEMASALILVTDVTAGVTPLDVEVARRLRASGKPTFLAVNKVDNAKRENAVMEFAALGFENIFPIAAAHGDGVSELLDAATEGFTAEAATEATAPTRIAIVGRPNVGKSSLLNAILKSERVIVSEVPGTTRDAVDVPFVMGDRQYVLVDTAGLKHRHKTHTSVEQFSLMRAERSIRECDIAVLVLDAGSGVTRQDKHIGGQIAEAACGCVLVVNKWDTVPRNERDRDEFVERVRRQLFFLDWAPVLLASAKTGAGLDRLFQLVGSVERELERRIETPELNRLFGSALQSYPPPMVRGRRFKVFYAFQRAVRPPTLTLFVNDAGALTPHYKRFLIDRIRSTWGFVGSPVVLECRQRMRKIFTEKTPNRKK